MDKRWPEEFENEKARGNYSPEPDANTCEGKISQDVICPLCKKDCEHLKSDWFEFYGCGSCVPEGQPIIILGDEE